MEQRLGDWEPSLDHPVGDDWRETRGDMLSSDTELFDKKIADHEFQEIFNRKLLEFKKLVDKKEFEILETRILSDSPVTLQSIGDKYGISKERVRQVESRLIGKIKQYMEEALPDFKRFKLPMLKKD
ncbi:MAG: sigma factor-like helix-turn-helix DNA-binding protein, partial [Pseudomonadota bacterium]